MKFDICMLVLVNFISVWLIKEKLIEVNKVDSNYAVSV